MKAPMRKAFCLLLFVLVLPLAACHRDDGGSRTGDSEEAGRNYIEMLRTNQFDEIVRNADPSLSATEVRTQLDKMAAQFPPEEPKSVKLIRARTLSGKD